MTQETLLNAQRWYESKGYKSKIHNDKLHLFLSEFSVELSDNEVEWTSEMYMEETDRDLEEDNIDN